MAEEHEEAEDDPSVLTPEELRIEDEDVIEKIGENRYIISPNEGRTDDDASEESNRRADPTARRSDPDASGPEPAAKRADRRENAARRTAESADGSEPISGEGGEGGDASETASADGPDVDLDARTVALEHAAGSHGIDVVLKTDAGIAERRITADDRVSAFEELLRWYARQVDGDAAPAATISALLAEADLSD